MEGKWLVWLQEAGGGFPEGPWLEMAATGSGVVLMAWSGAVFLFARRRPDAVGSGVPLYGLALLLALAGGDSLAGSLGPEVGAGPLGDWGRVAIALVGAASLAGMVRLLQGLDQAPSGDWLAAENRALRRESDNYRQRLEALEKEYEALALRHDEHRWVEERLQREVAAKEAELARERIRDEATGLFTRDHFLLRMREEFERALRRGGMPAPLFMGLQGLEALTAEEAARAMADMGKILSSCLRQPDIATRFSEQELVVVPVDTDEQGGVTLARRVHREVARSFSGGDTPVGVTFALVDFDVQFQEYQDFIAACDHVRAQLAQQEPGKLVRYSSGSVCRAMSG